MTATAATFQIGDWRRRRSFRLRHLFRMGADPDRRHERRPVCLARVRYAGTVPARSGLLADVCYGCLVYAARGR